MRDKTEHAPHYKTKPCLNFTSKGYCPYGTRCHYQHIASPSPEVRPIRSNSEGAKPSLPCNNTKTSLLWSMGHNKRIELIQTLGLDFSIR